MLTNFTEEGDEIRELFRTLLLKGKRDVSASTLPLPPQLPHYTPSHTDPQEIRFIFKVCSQQFTGELYHALRPHLYGYSSGKLNHKQFTALCEVSL